MQPYGEGDGGGDDDNDAEDDDDDEQLIRADYDDHGDGCDGDDASADDEKDDGDDWRTIEVLMVTVRVMALVLDHQQHHHRYLDQLLTIHKTTPLSNKPHQVALLYRPAGGHGPPVAQARGDAGATSQRQDAKRKQVFGICVRALT